MSIQTINNVTWLHFLVYGLLAAGAFLTCRLKFIQFKNFSEMFRVLRDAKERDSSGLSPFQALSVSLAARVGTGNIAGVAVALYLGGAGAIFWMWIVALLGMATSYSENTLAQLYKTRDKKGGYIGGPAYYMTRGLNAKWAGCIFSFLFLICSLVFVSVHSNSISTAIFGALEIPPIYTGILIAFITGLIIIGGVTRIAHTAELVVPIMASLYLLVVAIIMLLNPLDVFNVFKLIITSAFGLNEAVGGAAGGLMVALLNGVRRGLYSSEAGLGTTPNIAAMASPVPNHPCSQGFVQALGVFIDTILLCTGTAMIILMSGVMEPGSGVTGTALTQLALSNFLGGAGNYFLAGAVFLFSLTSIVAIYSHLVSSLEFLGWGGGAGRNITKISIVLMTLWGSVQTVQVVFGLADMFMGCLAILNLCAVIFLSKTVSRLTNDYLAQRKTHTPNFEMDDKFKIKGSVDSSIWKYKTSASKNNY